MRRQSSLLAAALAIALLSASTAMPAQQVDHYVRLTPENAAIGNFPAQKKPILTVKSGTTVKIDGGGGNRWREQDPMQWMKENNIQLTAAQAQAIKETDRVTKEATHYAGITSGHGVRCRLLRRRQAICTACLAGWVPARLRGEVRR